MLCPYTGAVLVVVILCHCRCLFCRNLSIHITHVPSDNGRVERRACESDSNVLLSLYFLSFSLYFSMFSFLFPVKADIIYFIICFFLLNSFTTWWTSLIHHFPLGFLTSQLQPLFFFSVLIFSRILEKPWFSKSSSIFFFVYSKQKQTKSSLWKSFFSGVTWPSVIIFILFR